MRYLPALRALVLVTLTSGAGARADTVPPPGSLRESFPAASIRSAQRADEALAATSGAKARVEKQYRSEARECHDTFLVNACVDRARARQRERLGEIDAVELEANRYQRRDKADRVEAERAKRENERTANAGADAAERARNRKAFDDKQSERTREAARQARTAALRDAPAAPRRPSLKAAPPRAVDAQQRARNATDHAVKVQEAEAHRKDIERRVAAKTADRKRRDDERKAREAKAAAAIVPSS